MVVFIVGTGGKSRPKIYCIIRLFKSGVKKKKRMPTMRYESF